MQPEILMAGPVAVPLLILGMAARTAAQMHAGAQAKKQGEKNAKRLEAQADEAVMLRRRRGRQLVGTQRSMFTRGGVDLSSPTAIDVLASTAAFEETEAQRAADPFRWEAEAQRQRGSQAFSSAVVGAGSTLLSGASAISLADD